MNPRPLLATAMTLLILLSTVSAQVPGAYAPAVIDNGMYSDPYAIVDPSATSTWYSGIPTISTPARLRDRLWLRTEYLRWGTEGATVPPLITTSPVGTPQNDAAILGEPGTRVLFGGNEINGSDVNGIRTRGGFWCRRDGVFAMEIEYIGLSSQSDGYAASSDGSTILGRPYFDIVAGNEAAHLVSFPGVVAGSTQVTSHTKLRSLLLNGRTALLPISGETCGVDAKPDRIDAIIGYRYLGLDDQISFNDSIDTLAPAAARNTKISEQFDTSNDFNGLQLGVIYQTHYRRAWLESMMRVAVGNTKQKVSIRGNTSITEAGVTTDYPGGLLAQRTNIGTYKHDQFTMIPELGLTLGYRLTNCFHATIGYTVLYFPSVVRAGNQIDRDVNPNLIAPETAPFSGALRPRALLVDNEYWAQGFSLGGELSF